MVIVDITGAPTVAGAIALDGTQPSFGDVHAYSDGTRLAVTTESLSDTSTVTVIDTAPFLASLAP